MHPLEVLLSPLGHAFRGRRAAETASLSHAPELATENHFAVVSPSFNDGDVIPDRHCGWLIGDNISPALSWDSLPAGTAGLLLLMEDLDSPGTRPRIHTIASFAPTAGGLPEAALAPGVPGVDFLPEHRGNGKYAGPRPMPGHGPHRYRFHLYALDTTMDVADLSDVEHLLAIVRGHVLASGTVTGTRSS